MTRKVVAGVLALGLVGVAVWLLVLRDRGPSAPRGPGDVRSTQVASNAPAPAPAPDPGPPPQGRAPRWSVDPDPEGRLRLEGQVLGPDGAPAGGATVWLGA